MFNAGSAHMIMPWLLIYTDIRYVLPAFFHGLQSIIP
jgi:hypothetical protein